MSSTTEFDFSLLTPEQIMAYETKRRPSIWAQRHTKLKGKDYRFERFIPGTRELDLKGKALNGQRQFLQQPLDDQHPWKSFQKSRQCGASENHVRETLWFADQYPHTSQVYVFPTDQQVSDFSKTRIDEVVKDSPYMLRAIGLDPKTRKKLPEADVVNSVHLRKIRDSFVYFRSGHTPKAGEGIPCDIVYFDEIDRMSANVMAAFNETLSSSEYGWRRDISTPSLPGVGVNFSFSRSDQQHYWMKCPHCNHFFTLILDEDYGIAELPTDSRGNPNHDFHLHYDFIQQDDKYCFACPKCRMPVSNETRCLGFWHPLYEGNKRVRGYQISQTICPWISANDIMNKKEDYQIEQLWMNYVIGLPYLGDNVLVTKNDIWACVDRSLTNPYELKRQGVAIGTDWGNESWFVTGMNHPDGSGRIILLDLHSVTDREAMVLNGRKDNPHVREAANKMRQWGAAKGVFDAGYGKDRNHELLNLFPARVFSCFYPNVGAANTKTFQDTWDEKGFKVSVDRTMTLKVATKMFVDRRVVIPQWVVENPRFELFVKHVTNLVSIKDIEEDPATHIETIVERVGQLPGGDHFGHAWNYLTIALRGQKNAAGNSDFFM